MAKKKLKGARKAPGMFSFVMIRQLFMVLSSVGITTSLAPVFDMQESFFFFLIAVAAPSLVHGQLWKWTYDWAGRGPAVMRNLRIGQIALGALHVGLAVWAISRVATGELVWDDAPFYHGLTIAGIAAGLWETVRPALEIKDPPEVKEAAERKAKKAAAKAAKAEASESGDTGADDPTDGVSAGDDQGGFVEDPEDEPATEKT